MTYTRTLSEYNLASPLRAANWYQRRCRRRRNEHCARLNTHESCCPLVCPIRDFEANKSPASQSRTNVSAACHNRNPWARPEGNPNESKHVLRWRRGDVGAAALFPDTLQTRKIMYDIRTTFIWKLYVLD